MKTKVTCWIIVLMLVISLVGCSVNEESVSETPSVETINISYVKLPLNVPSIVEKKLHMFEQEFEKDNIKVQFHEITQGPKMTQAVAAGSLDFCSALGGTSAILARANGVGLKVIGVFSRAPKAFTIMAKSPDIQTPADLKGKVVAGPKGTILHQLLLGALTKHGLKQTDVEFVSMGIPDAMAALTSEKIDAALIAGPAVPKALEAGAHIITTGEGILDATIVIAVREEFLRQHPDLVKRYMQVHSRSLEYMQKNPDKVYKMVAEETGISVEEVKKMYKWYDFNPEITQNDIKELEKTQNFLKQNGMLENTIEIQSLIGNLD